MIVDKVVKTRWNNQNRERLESLGYEFTGYQTEIWIKPEHLSRYSEVRVTIKCPKCEKLRTTRYDHYLSSTTGGVCNSCQNGGKKKTTDEELIANIIKASGDDGISHYDLIQRLPNMTLDNVRVQISNLLKNRKIEKHGQFWHYFWCEQEKEIELTDEIIDRVLAMYGLKRI